jgi:hypothetical protein
VVVTPFSGMLSSDKDGLHGKQNMLDRPATNVVPTVDENMNSAVIMENVLRNQKDKKATDDDDAIVRVNIGQQFSELPTDGEGDLDAAEGEPMGEGDGDSYSGGRIGKSKHSADGKIFPANKLASQGDGSFKKKARGTSQGEGDSVADDDTVDVITEDDIKSGSQTMPKVDQDSQTATISGSDRLLYARDGGFTSAGEGEHEGDSKHTQTKAGGKSNEKASQTIGEEPNGISGSVDSFVDGGASSEQVKEPIAGPANTDAVVDHAAMRFKVISNQQTVLELAAVSLFARMLCYRQCELWFGIILE